MKDYNEVERYLKRCLKNSKQFGFTIGLLVAFLISGGLGFAEEIAGTEQASEVPSIISRRDIHSGIQKEKENALSIWNQNEKAIQETELKIKHLLQRGAFWVKPLEDSYQFFFQYDWKNYSKNSNRTRQNFKGGEYVKENNLAYGYGKIYKGINYGAYGVIKNPFEFVDNVDFGANITPKAVEEKIITEKTVTQKAITPPIVTSPTVAVGQIETAEVSAPNIGVLTEPTAPNIAITAPTAINSLGGIAVSTVAPVLINVATPATPQAPSINAPTVTPPATPGGFVPRVVTPPEAPADITVTAPTILSPTLKGGGANPSADIYYYWDGNDGAISQVSVTSGSVDITGNVTGYSGGNMTLTLNNFHVSAYPGTNPNGYAPVNGTYGLDRRFFNTLLNVPYSEFGSGVTINYNYNKSNDAHGYEGAVINLETEGDVAGDLNSAATSNQITAEKKDILKKYQSYSGITGADNGATELLFINKGTVNLLSNDAIYLFTTTHSEGSSRTNYIDNEGNINAKGKNSIIIKHTPDTASGRGWIYSNSATGKMYADGEGSVIMGWAFKNLQYGRAAFVNAGEIKLRGKKSVGIFMASDKDTSINTKMAPGSSVYLTKPIDLLGDESMGWVSQNTGVSSGSGGYLVQFNIGNEEQDSVLGESKGAETKVEAAIGILQDHTDKTDAATIIKFGEHSKGSIGIYATKGTLNVLAPDQTKDVKKEDGTLLTTSEIDLKAGEQNIGMVASKEGSNPAANINFTGEAKITGGTEQKLAIAEKGGKITLKDKVIVGDKATNNFIKDTVPFYAVGTDSTIVAEKSDLLQFYLSGNSTAAYTKDKATINIDRTALPSEPSIYVKGTNNKGMGLFTKDGGVINAKNHHIKVEDGSVALSSLGVSGSDKSKIDFTGGKIDYKGNGYAVYAKNGGIIDLTNGEIVLRGRSTAMELDTSITNPVTFTGGKITVMSNDVIVYNLTNINTPMNISGLRAKISGLTSGATVVAGTENGTTFDKYKIAAVDGGTLNIDVAVDKSGDANTTDGGYFFKRFLGQRLKVNVNENVTAKLTTTQANADYNGQVVGIEANSSKKATNVDETQINIAAGKTVEAARTDAGAGAIGTFINYGQLKNQGTIKVEKDTTENNQAVGVYAVNGSKVDNKGTVEVGGNQSVGILGMAHRVHNNNPVGNEFGGKTGEGLINITNDANSKIAMSGEKAIGIYAENNNTATNKTNHSVVNKGTIEVERENAIGIYGDKVQIDNDGGKIHLGENAVGIYAKDSDIKGNSLGTIHFNGNNGVGLYITGNGSTLENKSLRVENASNKTGNVAILFDQSNPVITGAEVDVGNSDNIISYYTKSSDLTVTTAIKTNKNSVGIAGAEGKKLDFSGTTLAVGEGSTGILGKKNEITLANTATAELQGERAIGIYSDSDGETKNLFLNGKLKFISNAKNAVGVYALNGTDVKLDSTTGIDFTTAKKNIGFYIAGSSFSGNPNAVTLNYNHEDENIYIYAQGSKNSSNVAKGSTVSLFNKLTLTPADTSSTKKAIGIYLDTAVKGSTTEFEDNTLSLTESSAKIEVSKKAIGVYAKNESTDKFNILSRPKITAKEEGTVGVYTDGNLKLDSAGGNITADGSAVGVYGNKGKILVADQQNVELTNKGTGIYLTNGSSLEGSSLHLKNNTVGTAAAGVYYTKGSENSEVEHKTELQVNDGNNLLALYADGGIKLKNSANITIAKGKDNVGAFVTGKSELNNNADITLVGNDLEQGLGVYVADGKATNLAGKTIKVEDKKQSSLSVGMVADKSTTGTSASVVNVGNIKAIGDAVGMYVGDNSSGENTAEITAENTTVAGTDLKAIGAYVKGANAKFKNTGNISSENVVLALDGTTAGNVTLGNLKLTANNAVGVYANDAKIDFDVQTTTDKDKTVALYAAGTTEIQKTVTSSAGKGHVGVYVKDSTVTFKAGSKVVVNNGQGTDFGVGIYTEKGFNGNIETNIQQNGKETIGLFLGSDAGTGSQVNYKGTIDVGSGIGIYVPEHSKFVSNDTTFKVVNGGTAVYLKGGEVDLGSSGVANIDFGTSTSGRAIYQDGGTVTTGAGLHITGTGSFLALKNANTTVNSIVNVGANGIGINGIYDSNAQNYTLTLASPTGDIKLNGDKATGIAAVVKNTVAPHTVDVVNAGTIETVSGNQTTGIYAVGANVTNEAGAKIDIGAKGVGIYTSNENSLSNTTLKNNGEINLNGEGATGIVAMKVNTNQDFIGGKITGTADKLVGMYFKDSVTGPAVKNFNISLGTNARGLIFDAGQDFTLDSTTATKNKITVGKTTDTNSRGIGISALDVNGTVSKTEVIVGENSLGLYAKGKKLSFDLASGKLESSAANKNSILAYADGNNSEVAVNGGGTLSIGKDGIALGTKSGKITTDVATTIEVDGVKGLGAYVENGGEVSDLFDIKVKSAEGIGMYAKGGILNSFAKVSEIKGNKSIGYVFENITNAIAIHNPVALTDATATEQVGVAAIGTGAGLTVDGVSVVGSKNIGIYNKTQGAVTNNGTLAVGDSTGDSSIGIYSEKGKVTSNGNATVGKNSVGIYGKETGAKVDGNVTVDEKGVGLYVDNTDSTQGDTEITGTLSVGASGAIGIQAKNSKSILEGDLTVGAEDSKGIFSEGNTDVEAKGNITVGKNSVGVYKNGTGEVKTFAGKTLTVDEKGYGIFSKGAKVTNQTNVTVGEDGIGIYVDGNDLTSTGSVTVGDKGVGLLVKGSGKTLTSNGAISVASNNSVGLYAGDNANVVQTGNITIADNNGIGVYSKGTGTVTTLGNITVGKDSIGVYKDGTGAMTIGAASQTMTIGEKGYGIYSKGANVNSRMAMTLGKEAVGIYAKGASVSQEGDIIVGETTIGANGFSDPNVNKNSIGIFGDNSIIEYKGNMTVDKPLSVGIYGMNGGRVVLKTGSILNVKNGAYGIMTGKGVSQITVENGATINVDGKATLADAGDKNVSFGIAAYSGDIYNNGIINVTNGATGIYVAGTSKLINQGTITIGAGGGKVQDKPGTNAAADIGGIKVTDKGEVTIGNRVITGGKISIDGDLTMQGLGIDVSTGKTVIDAKSISGTAFVTPDFSTGSNEQKITIKDVFQVPHQGIGAFTGDIKSQSVSWIAKISDGTKSEHGPATTKDIVMVRIPYQSLIAGEKYKNLASGLDEIRQNLPKGMSSDIFKSFDNIKTHGEFAKAVANVRGDVYSNIQERMKTVESVFEKSYHEVLDSYNVTRDVNKFSIINSKGKHEDSTFGVSGYDYDSVGVLYLNDREGFRYGEKYGWSAGLVGSHFHFNGDTAKDSKERILSGKLGFHYQRALDREDDNAAWKWLSRAELSVNRHRTTRNSKVGRDQYQYHAKFWSGEIAWKNKVFYDYDINTKWSVRPYVGMDASYGHIFNVSESGNELKLQVKGKDYFVITPKVGAETKYVIPLQDTHQVVLKADAQYLYDVTKLYDDANRAKMNNSKAGYYDLTEPEFRRGRVAVGAEIGYEKENNYGITLRAEYQGNKKSDLNYSVRFNYKF